MVSTNHLKQNPVGLDKVIQDVQRELYGFLIEKWNGPIQGFGRVYRNPRKSVEIDAVIPEWYISNGEYEPVYFDDSYAGNFFFIEDQTHESNDGFVFDAKIKLAFMVDLAKILPGYVHRPDEEARKQVVSFVRDIADQRYEITGLQKGIDAVLIGFDKSQVKFNDYGTRHTFCIRLTMKYSLTDC